ncbi:MAG: hypothetical protein ACYC27_15460 [Armatimonadota bacterium]
MSLDQQASAQWSIEDLFKIAKWQKSIIRLILLQILASVGLVMLEGILESEKSGLSIEIIYLAIIIFIIIIAILLIRSVYYLVVSLRKSTPILYALAMLFSCVSLIILLILNNEASNVLRANGINVGIMGVNKIDLNQLQEGMIPQNNNSG